jgi:hypothetical protein
VFQGPQPSTDGAIQAQQKWRAGRGWRLLDELDGDVEQLLQLRLGARLALLLSPSLDRLGHLRHALRDVGVPSYIRCRLGLEGRDKGGDRNEGR